MGHSFCCADNPREFLKEYLTNLKAARERRGDGPKLFGEENLKSLFGMLDPVGSGSITKTQYVEGNKYVEGIINTQARVQIQKDFPILRS